MGVGTCVASARVACPGGARVWLYVAANCWNWRLTFQNWALDVIHLLQDRLRLLASCDCPVPLLLQGVSRPLAQWREALATARGRLPEVERLRKELIKEQVREAGRTQGAGWGDVRGQGPVSHAERLVSRPLAGSPPPPPPPPPPRSVSPAPRPRTVAPDSCASHEDQFILSCASEMKPMDVTV